MVLIRDIAPPFAGILYKPDRPDTLETKHIKRPSGDQQGEDSAAFVVVNRLKPEPFILAIQISGLPDLLRTIATRLPSGETLGLIFDPEYRATILRSPVLML
jgi:hypothetical protein